MCYVTSNYAAKHRAAGVFRNYLKMQAECGESGLLEPLPPSPSTERGWPRHVGAEGEVDFYLPFLHTKLILR